jgi:RNAse (barnase) inhibitor barstar
MITNFEINKIYEQNLEATFNINDGVFENNNDTLVLSTIIPIKNIKELTF